MIWLVNVLSLMLAFSHVVGVSTPDEAPPVDCDALDNWLPAVAMATDSSLQQRRARFAIHPTLRQYTIGHPISVAVDGITDFIDVTVQARPVSRDQYQPLGLWIYDDASDPYSCHGTSRDTGIIRVPLLVRHATFKWLPIDLYGSIRFVALVTEPSGEVNKIVSDVINPSKTSLYSEDVVINAVTMRKRLKRDIQVRSDLEYFILLAVFVFDIPDTEYILAWFKNGTSTNGSFLPDGVTDQNVVTTATSTTDTKIDLETFFYYFSIAGAYVGMYTVFSLLLV
ncbi:hypothetical protein LSH36_579g02023 [Paralvinella palmiformis]|uniref:Uncharacterized protein n=1 Tax=Paralvinella palmiformis TaxID=53620 RepID=A0AAD9J5Q3_9ANNE|nr:hypothetical protein LSH36_579g02023 [Paralvinella palmiformis]